MSFNAGNQTEADHIPGAFPSEDEVLSSEQKPYNTSQDTAVSGNKATTEGTVDEKKREFLEQQEAAHSAGGREANPLGNKTTTGGTADEKTRDFLGQQEAAHSAGGRGGADKSIAGTEQIEQHPGTISSQDGVLSQQPSRTGLEDASSSGSRTAEAPNAGQQNPYTHNTSLDGNSIGTNLATVATAVGLAAKDALYAAKDSAVPAANAATEQAKNFAGYASENAGPAANYAAEQAGNAAAYTKNTVTSDSSSGSRDTVPTDTAFQTAGSAANYAKDTAYSAVNTAQSYAPNVLGEPTTSTSPAPAIESSRETESLKTTSGPGVGDKSQVEEELLGQRQTQETTKKPQVDLTSRVKGLEEQLAPESMTPGVVTVLGTEQDRSFPLGGTDHVVST